MTNGFYVPSMRNTAPRGVRPSPMDTAQWMTPPVDDMHRENNKLARLSTEAPRIPWDMFLRDHLQWRPGQHFALIGPTGQGKTTMLLNLLMLHQYLVVFATKPKDDTMEALIQRGFLRMEKWQSIDPIQHPRRVLWPDASSIDSADTQRIVFHHAFASIYREGGWTVALDETWYMANELKLGHDIKMYLLQARSLGVSLLCATQRPASVPLEMYDQSTHLMFWRDNDETNLKRISGISWRSADLIRHIVSNLDEHQVLYINTRTGKMIRTRCPAVHLATEGR